MLEQHHRTESVDLECVQSIVVVDLAGRLLWVQDAGDGEREVEVGRLFRERGCDR